MFCVIIITIISCIGDEMDKILLINKEKGYTSRDVVNVISGIFKTKKVGHFGTLDPLATGVLIIGIGACTKVLNILEEDDKEYICKVLLGVSTDTYDVTGNVLSENSDFSLDKDKLVEVLNSFLGRNIQEVPIYSAVKVNGKKLYEYARNNEKIDLPKREVFIKSISLLDFSFNSFTFKILVSKGTYIRSIVNDISKRLGIPMCMSELTRTMQDKFLLKDCYTISDVKNNNFKFLDIEDVVSCKKMKISEDIYKKVMNGSLIDNIYDSKYVLFMNDDLRYALYGVYNKDKKYMKPYLFFKE